MPKQVFYNISEKRRNRVLDVAMREFTEKTFDKVSVRDIVRKSGISIGSFYRYFETKDELYIFIVDHTLNLFWNKRKQLEWENGRTFGMEEILGIDAGQRQFWDNFNKSSLYIRKKYYFRTNGNLLFDNFHREILEAETNYNYKAVEKKMMAFLLTVLQYVITEFQVLEGSGHDEEEYFQFFKKIVMEGYIGHRG